eukprot:11207329-Lingulodinium_polyedra.AAC.1
MPHGGSHTGRARRARGRPRGPPQTPPGNALRGNSTPTWRENPPDGGNRSGRNAGRCPKLPWRGPPPRGNTGGP